MDKLSIGAKELTTGRRQYRQSDKQTDRKTEKLSAMSWSTLYVSLIPAI